MSEPFSNFHLTNTCAELAIQVKRHTGLKHWNEICRLAFCRSIAIGLVADPHSDRDSSIEIIRS